jgi:hypothetical protein
MPAYHEKLDPTPPAPKKVIKVRSNLIGVPVPRHDGTTAIAADKSAVAGISDPVREMTFKTPNPPVPATAISQRHAAPMLVI